MNIDEFIPLVKDFRQKEIAEFFRRNLHRARALSMVHHLTAARQLLEQRLMETFKRLPMRIKRRTAELKGATPEETQRIVGELLAETTSKMNKKSGTVWDQAKEFIEEVADDDLLKEPLQILGLSTVMATWSAFESAMADSWISAVNARPDLFATKVIKAFEEQLPQGMSAKCIPVGIAAKYNFNLTNHIGDIVGARIDFTQLNEIRKSYKAAFGLDAVIENMFDGKDLKELMWARNLIAHRSGVVDARYKELTDCTEDIGEDLQISQEKQQGFIEMAGMAGMALIKSADLALQR